MILRFALLLAIPLSLAACGARSDLGSTGGASTTPGGDSPLHIVVRPVDDLFEVTGNLISPRIVARSQGFDLLALTDGAPYNILARRASVATAPLALGFAGPASPIVGDTLDSFEAAASGDLLAVCHNHADADPILLSTFTGAYTSGLTTTLFPSGSLCDGLVLRGDQGVVAVNKRPDDGKCCVRPEIAPITSAGAITGPSALALPDGETADVRISPYGQGYLSAGFVSKPGIFLHFDQGDTLGIDSSTSLDVRPRLAAWPFDENEAAVGFANGEGTAHIAIVRGPGETPPSIAQLFPLPEGTTTPLLASLTDGLLSATMDCAADGGVGRVVFALRGAGGEVIAGPVDAPGACPASVLAGAAFDDLALFAWPTQGGGVQGALVQVTR